MLARAILRFMWSPFDVRVDDSSTATVPEVGIVIYSNIERTPHETEGSHERAYDGSANSCRQCGHVNGYHLPDCLLAERDVLRERERELRRRW